LRAATCGVMKGKSQACKNLAHWKGEPVATSFSEKAWLRYAVERTAAPGRLTVISLIIAVIGLMDYVLSYLDGHIETANIIFCSVGVIAVLLGVVSYSWEQAELFHTSNKLIDDTVASKFELEVPIAFPHSYISSGYEIHRGKHGSGLWSRHISRRLFERSMNGSLSGTMIVRSGCYTGLQALRRTVGAKEAVNATRAKKLFRNDLKIRLCSDILLTAGNGVAIELQKTDYLASRSSNDISFKKVALRSTGLDHSTEVRSDVQYDGLSFFLSGDAAAPVFRGYADSECSNQIGASTIAITRDNWLLLVDQRKGGLESPDLIAPSGSGSLDWQDLPTDTTDTDFWSWVISASARELREELGIASERLPALHRLRNRGQVKWMDSVSVRSALIGFGGLLHRGGKPDFFFLAKLGCTLDEIRESSYYGKEEAVLSQRCEVGAHQKLRGTKATDLMELIERNGSARDSLPLELGFLMLDELCRSCPKAIEAFLKSS
jgi:hypothetical protein